MTAFSKKISLNIFLEKLKDGLFFVNSSRPMFSVWVETTFSSYIRAVAEKNFTQFPIAMLQV